MKSTPRFGLTQVDATDKGAPFRAAINASAAALDALDFGYEDFLQAGVVNWTDWAIALAINATSGRLSTTAPVGGVAWTPDPSVTGALVRTVTPLGEAAVELEPYALPSLGKYRRIDVAIHAQVGPEEGQEPAWGKPVGPISLRTSANVASQKIAEETVPSLKPHDLVIATAIVFDNASKYEIVKQLDRRPWARGARYITALSTTPAVRLEIVSGLVAMTAYADKGGEVSFKADGATLETRANAAGALVISTPLALAAGSHLFTAASTTGANLILRVEELAQNANNGTA